MKLKLLIILVLFSGAILSQTYLSLTPTLSNSPGTMFGKTNMSLELGYQWDVISIGLVGGKTSLAKMKNDTTMYAEIRTNLNVFQQADLTNTITIGAGGIRNAKNYFLTELTYTIEYALSQQVHMNILAGQYFYSGVNTMENETIVGCSLMYFFKPFGKKKSMIKVESEN